MIQHQILKTNFERNVWQRVRRLFIEILVRKGFKWEMGDTKYLKGLFNHIWLLDLLAVQKLQKVYHVREHLFHSVHCIIIIESLRLFSFSCKLENGFTSSGLLWSFWYSRSNSESRLQNIPVWFSYSLRLMLKFRVLRPQWTFPFHS